MSDSPVTAEAATAAVLNVAGISKRFGALQVLTDISFTVARGETVCVVGPSGSGKSTLLRCINWLERPDSGRVFLEREQVGTTAGGIVMGDKELSLMRTRIGMVFQHFALWPHLTVLQNVMEAPLHVQGRPKAEVREEAEALLARVGLSDKIDVFPARLSGRPEAARGHRACPGHEARAYTVRRADQRARSGARGRGADGDARSRARGHDHGRGDARDELRPRGRRPGDLHGSWRHRRNRAPGGVLPVAFHGSRPAIPVALCGLARQGSPKARRSGPMLPGGRICHGTDVPSAHRCAQACRALQSRGRGGRIHLRHRATGDRSRRRFAAGSRGHRSPDAQGDGQLAPRALRHRVELRQRGAGAHLPHGLCRGLRSDEQALRHLLQARPAAGAHHRRRHAPRARRTGRDRSDRSAQR